MYESTWKRDLAFLEEASRLLLEIQFPSLIRPRVVEREPPTEELINWAIQIYCFGLLSHYREMLRSLVALIQTSHIPAAFVVARCLFEMGAHAYYVHKHVTQHLQAEALDSAWKFLEQVNMGSRYMREEIERRVPGQEDIDFPAPREVARVMRAFDEWGNYRRALVDYSFLSEFSHPNMAAFSHYYRMEKDKENRITVNFVEQKRGLLETPMPIIRISLTVLLLFTSKLLGVTDERDVIQKIDEVLQRDIDSNSSGAGETGNNQ